MNDQIAGLVKVTLAALGGYLAGHGISAGLVSALTGPDALTFYSGLLSVGIPAILSLLSHTTSAKLAAVEALPEVKKIIVDPTKSVAISDIVIDSSRPKVTERG